MYSLDVYQTIHDDRRARHEAAALRRRTRGARPVREPVLRDALMRLRCALQRDCEGAVPATAIPVGDVP